MNTPSTRLRWIATRGIIALAAAGLALAASAQANSAWDNMDRTFKSEFYALGSGLHQEDITFDAPPASPTTTGVKIKMNDTTMWGFGMAYHVSNRWAVNAEFMWGNSEFSGDLPTQSGGTFHVKQDASLGTGRLNATYTFTNKRFAPFVTGGIGYQHLKTELSNLPPSTVCWWDPWWGWICSTGTPQASETYFTWNLGAGVRWDITDSVFLKATVGATWLQYGGANKTTTQTEAIFALGWSW